MIEIIILIVGIFVLSGIFWHSIFYQKEKKLLNRLQQMLDCAIDGELERTEISEEKYSALENSMKQHLDSSFLARKNQQEQKEVIQKLISDIAHQTLTPISNLKIYGEIIYVFLTIFLYLLKCPQSLILSALRAFCFCGKPHISRSIFLYFRYQAWLKSW